MSHGRRIGILGLARSGRGAAALALAEGATVYASDAGDTPALREAAAWVRERGGHADLGGHDLAALARCDLLVISPGIPPTAPVLTDPRVAGIPSISELEFAFDRLHSPAIAITGTNGKTTTTALTAHLLRSAGLDAPAAGNIGVALSEVALREDAPDWVVVEASSFQLGGTRSFAPRIGVLTNLAPDHLDRYPTVEAYYADKAKLFSNASAESIWVLNGEDPEVLALIGESAGRRYHFRVRTELADHEEGGYCTAAGELVLSLDGVRYDLLSADELQLLGAHNRANALAAALVATQAGADLDAVRRGLRSFRPLAHRLEPVLERDGVLWINDSKATNISSTRVAVEGMARPTVLLLGGRHKGESYTHLLDLLEGRVRVVIAYGEAGAQIEAELGPHLPVERVDGPFDAVVARAAELARSGDAVLLSPACSSYDTFRNYEERGDRFRNLVRGGGDGD